MADDPFLYPGTKILRNKKGLRDPIALDKFERKATQWRLAQLEAKPVRGDFDLPHLQAVHKFIFQDVYPWAGKLREGTGTMTKRRLGAVVQYGNSAYVASEATRVFRRLAGEGHLKGLDAPAFAKRLAFYYSELDAIHAFREGNSRTLRAFTSQLARQAGHTLDWSLGGTTDEARNALYQARDAAVMDGKTGPLEALAAQALGLVPAPAPQAASGRAPAGSAADAARLPAPSMPSSGGAQDPAAPEAGAPAVLKAMQQPAAEGAAPWDKDLTPLAPRLDAYLQRKAAEAAQAAAPTPGAAGGQPAPAPAPDTAPRAPTRDRDPGPGF